MKKPTSKDRINLRVYRVDGVIVCENIVGVVRYPVAIQRSITEHEQIIAKQRKRHSANWHVTHIPTGKSFGIANEVFDNVVGYVSDIVDHPVLLMLTDDTMTSHPMYSNRIDEHASARQRWAV